ncbi:MAG: hypothetical protein WD794_05270 [Mycobacteriales bacterium]
MLGGVRGRVRRTPALVAILTVGGLGVLVILALNARPSAEASSAVGLERGYVGTTYAFDGLVCVLSPQVAAEVLSVEVEQAEGSVTRLVRPPSGPPVIGFPVDDPADGADPGDGGGGGDPADGQGDDVAGYPVPPGEGDCTLRVLVTPTRTGAVTAGTLRIRMAYGPSGLLRRTAAVRPEIRLDVTGTGRDPRTTTGRG